MASRLGSNTFSNRPPTVFATGEVVFVSGNPGRTQRIFTLAALKYQRDHYLPYVLDFLRRREILWQQFSLEGEEQDRRAKDDLLGHPELP